MGLVREEVIHDELPMSLTVIEREKGEMTEPWRFIALDFDHFERLTPHELRKLGRWMIQEGKRFGREYKSNGTKKVTPNINSTTE